MRERTWVEIYKSKTDSKKIGLPLGVGSILLASIVIEASTVSTSTCMNVDPDVIA